MIFMNIQFHATADMRKLEKIRDFLEKDNKAYYEKQSDLLGAMMENIINREGLNSEKEERKHAD